MITSLPSAPSWRIGIDVGGTFTDLVAVPGDGETWRLGDAVTHKVSSTPADPSEGVENGLAGLLELGIPVGAVAAITHGTTIGLNAILQGRVARAALVTSTGHRDVLQIARARLPRSFDLHANPTPPIIPRSRVFEVDARFDAAGSASAEPEVAGIADQVRASGAEVVVVSLIGGYAAREAEARVAASLADDLDVPVRSAAALWPQAGEYERVTLAILDAQITPLMTGYFTSLRRRLAGLGVDAPLYISTSNGGSVSIDAAIAEPIQTVLSGPASGVSAAATTWGDRNLVTFDMGGTSSDIGVLRGGAPVLTTSATIGPHPLIMPVVEVSAIGAGGGSVIWADDGGAETVLRVGPESTGAVPGPAAYGLGGERPALTDAYIQAGIIDPAHFLGGSFPLRPERATAALAAVGARLGTTADGVLDASLTIASAGMASRLRRVLAARGEIPEQFSLVAFGGAGATHAALLAREVGIGSVLIPAAAGTFCALGASIAPVRRDGAQTLRVAVTGGADPLREAAEALRREAAAWLDENQPGARAVLAFSADLHYAGQPTTLEVSLGAEVDSGELPEIDESAILDRFTAQHERVYGFTEDAAAITSSTVRVAMTVALGRVAQGSAGGGFREVSAREVRYDGSPAPARVFVVDAEGSVPAVAGPAVIERPDTTVLVPAGWTARIAEAGSIELTSEAGK
ncbi:hydantoinase/oxoprolinase family protein [Microbacterium indicum]|uniref:hydantoinase/oxoprolinase family protein n=1 Tax=Microbacterium indicum TaxID=358100 RepID=UPI000421E411|nr:hydantoinase/oxoprolinase family protein [Microbacterium indicum]